MCEVFARTDFVVANLIITSLFHAFFQFTFRLISSLSPFVQRREFHSDRIELWRYRSMWRVWFQFTSLITVCVWFNIWVILLSIIKSSLSLSLWYDQDNFHHFSGSEGIPDGINLFMNQLAQHLVERCENWKVLVRAYPLLEISAKWSTVDRFSLVAGVKHYIRVWWGLLSLARGVALFELFMVEQLLRKSNLDSGRNLSQNQTLMIGGLFQRTTSLTAFERLWSPDFR